MSIEFKDSMNSWRTKTLFRELLTNEDIEKYNPPYTLNEEDIEKKGRKYKSLYKLFMQSVDEFDFATNHLGGPAHWEFMQKSKWFGDGYRTHRGVHAWREDMRARDESLAKKALILKVQEGDVSAAKKLYDMSKAKEDTKRGRFVKEEARKEAAKKVADQDFIEEAWNRLNVVKLYE